MVLKFRNTVLLALVFCLLGDILLLKPSYFLFGLISFLIAHLLFAKSWPKSSQIPIRCQLVPISYCLLVEWLPFEISMLSVVGCANATNHRNRQRIQLSPTRWLSASSVWHRSRWCWLCGKSSRVLIGNLVEWSTRHLDVQLWSTPSCLARYRESVTSFLSQFLP